MSKIALAAGKPADKTTIDPEIIEAGKKASPLIRGICEAIFARAKVKASEKDADQAEVDKLFRTFANDSTTTRIAQVFELLTGIQPNTNAIPFEIGDVVVNTTSKKVYVIVHNTASQSYGVSASGDAVDTFGTGYSPGVKANMAETGEYAKALLATSGFKFLNYINTSIGAAAGPKFLETLKLTDLL